MMSAPLAACAAIAMAALALVALAAVHLLRPDIHPARTMISQYALGRFGWVMALCFAAFAAASAFLAIAVFAEAPSTPGRIGVVFLSVAAIGLAMAAHFPMDPVSTVPAQMSFTGRMHGVSFLIGVPAMVLGVLLVSLALIIQGSHPLLLLAALAVLICLSLVFMMTIMLMVGPGKAPDPNGPERFIGFPNRLFMVAYAGWVIVVAWPVTVVSRAGWLIVLMPLLCCLSGTVAGQVFETLSFEVASVKPNVSRTGVRGHSYPGDRFEAKNVPLRDLVMVAYGRPGQLLTFWEMAGGPPWIDSDRFDVSAKVADGASTSVAQKQLMVRRLLSERFKLAAHFEKRVLPVYALVRSRKDSALGPALHRADVDCEPVLASQPGLRERCLLYALPSGDLILRGQSIDGLAYALTILLGRVVVNKTGLTGGFDLDAKFNPEGLPGMALPPASDRPVNPNPPLLTVLQEQLGLKLEPTKGPVDVLVIDHAEAPSEN